VYLGHRQRREIVPENDQGQGSSRTSCPVSTGWSRNTSGAVTKDTEPDDGCDQSCKGDRLCACRCGAVTKDTEPDDGCDQSCKGDRLCACRCACGTASRGTCSTTPWFG